MKSQEFRSILNATRSVGTVAQTCALRASLTGPFIFVSLAFSAGFMGLSYLNHKNAKKCKKAIKNLRSILDEAHSLENTINELESNIKPAENILKDYFAEDLPEEFKNLL